MYTCVGEQCQRGSCNNWNCPYIQGGGDGIKVIFSHVNHEVDCSEQERLIFKDLDFYSYLRNGSFQP